MKNIVLHMSWTIFILVIVVFLLFSVRLSANTQVANVLSFAVGFTSLFVGLIAIAQSAFGAIRSDKVNASIQDNVAQISKPAIEIANAATELKRAISALDTKTDNIQQHVERLGSPDFTFGSSVKNSSTNDKSENQETDKPTEWPNEVFKAGGLAVRCLLYYVARECKSQLDGPQSGRSRVQVSIESVTEDYTMGAQAVFSTIAALGYLEIDFSGHYLTIDNDRMLHELIEKRIELINFGRPRQRKEFIEVWSSMFRGQTPTPEGYSDKDLEVVGNQSDGEAGSEISKPDD